VREDECATMHAVEGEEEGWHGGRTGGKKGGRGEGRKVELNF